MDQDEESAPEGLPSDEECSDPTLAWLQQMSSLADTAAAASQASSAALAAAENVLVETQLDEAALTVALQLTEPAGPELPATSRASDRFDNWAVINKALEPIAERRGKQLHDALLASACSGATVEARVLPKVLVRAKFLYLCDPSQAAWNFNNDNGPARDHYFADLDALSKDGAGFCIDHAQVCNISDHWLGQLGRRITSLIAGLSCRPYSTANNQRNSGTQDHSESHLFEAFVREAKRLNVLEAWFENVLGLLIRESKTEPQAPIRRILDRAKEIAPEYDVGIYFVDSAHFNVLTRRRVYIHLLHSDAGGAEAHKRMDHYIMVRQSCMDRMHHPNSILDILYFMGISAH